MEAYSKPRINNQITAPELRVIGEKGENLGVMPRAEALKLARPDDGVDLIEISANAKPPVVRLMSYDKFRYEEEKRIKKERLAQKSAAMKTVQISAQAPRITTSWSKCARSKNSLPRAIPWRSRCACAAARSATRTGRWKSF